MARTLEAFCAHAARLAEEQDHLPSGAIVYSGRDFSRSRMMGLIRTSREHEVRIVKWEGTWLMADASATFHSAMIAGFCSAIGKRVPPSEEYARNMTETMPLTIAQHPSDKVFRVNVYGADNDAQEQRVCRAFTHDPMFRRLFQRGDLLSFVEADPVEMT